MTETLADKLAAEFEDDREWRTFRVLTDIQQAHLGSRWWS